MIKFILEHGAEMPTRSNPNDTGMDLKVRGYSTKKYTRWFDEENINFNQKVIDGKYKKVKPGKTVLFKTGVRIQCFFKKYHFNNFNTKANHTIISDIQVRPRSGVSLKTDKLVILGTIDKDYTGDIGIIVKNIGKKTVKIFENEKLAQLVIGTAIISDEIEVVKSFEETDRGEKGFGSSGV